MRPPYNDIKKAAVRYRIPDAALLAILLSISVFSIRSYIQALPDPLDHNFHPLLSLLYPSIFFAAGHELGTTDIEKFPEIEKFISRKTDSLDLSTLPDDLALQPPRTAYELSHLYLLYAAGWVWRIWGVSVDSLMILAYAFYVMNSAFLYLLFRHFLRPVIAFAATLLTILSPPFLTISISLRDYSKGPFILLFLVLLIWLVKKRNQIPHVLWLSSACAAVLGLGTGFRQDCLVGIPLFLVAIVVLPPWNRQQRPLLTRLGALTLFSIIFYVIARPVLGGISMEGGEVAAHTFVQGISTEAENAITFGDASYEILPNTWDTTTYATIVTYARRTGNTQPMINPHSAEYQKVMGNEHGPLCFNSLLYFVGQAYGQSGNQFLLDVVRLFPADLAIRAMSTVTHILQVPHRRYAFFEPQSAHASGMLGGFHAVNKATAHLLFQLSGILIAAYVLLFFFRLRIDTLYFFFALFVLMSYPSILLQERHYYHLVFVPYLLFFGLVSLLLRAVFTRPVSALVSPLFRKSLWRGLTIGVGMLLGAVFGIVLLRAWQHRQVDLLADQIRAADREPVPYSIMISEGAAHITPMDVLPQLKDAASLPAGEVAWEYLMIAMHAEGKEIPVSIEYDPNRAAHDLSSTFTVTPAPRGENAEVFFCFPVYEIDVVYSPSVVEDAKRMFPHKREFLEAQGPDFSRQELWKRGRFIGISFPKEFLPNFRGLYRLSGNLPTVLPFISIPENPRYLVRHKTTPGLREHLARYLEFRMLANLGRYQAKEEYLKLLAHYPNDIWMFKRYHDLLFQLKPETDYIDGIVAAAKRFDLLRPHAAVLLSEAGDQWEEAGKIEEAYKAYMASAKLNPYEKWYAIRLEQLADDAVKGAH